MATRGGGHFRPTVQWGVDAQMMSAPGSCAATHWMDAQSSMAKILAATRCSRIAVKALEPAHVGAATFGVGMLAESGETLVDALEHFSRRMGPHMIVGQAVRPSRSPRCAGTESACETRARQAPIQR